MTADGSNLLDVDIPSFCEYAVVAVLEPGRQGELLGTGFYITPDLVLTCAHVLNGRRRVRIRNDTVDVRGVVELAVPERSPADLPWGRPDLALIRVPRRDDRGKGGVVWLELGPDYRIEAAEWFLDWGYDKVGLDQVSCGDRTFRAAGRRMARRSLDVIEVTGDSVPKFRSGSPVIDKATGRVVGVMKASRAPNDGKGGYVIPLQRWLTEALGGRADKVIGDHDRFHARDRVWPAACALVLPPPRPEAVSGRPLLEVVLLDLLADARTVLSDEQQADLVEPLVRGRLLARGTSLRDALLTLAGQTAPNAVNPHELLVFFDRFAATVRAELGPRWSQDAAKWIQECADALGHGSRWQAHLRHAATLDEGAEEPAGGYPVLRVHVQPTLQRSGGYDVSVRLHHAIEEEAAEPEQGPSEPVDRAALWPLLRELLPKSIASLPRRASTVLDLIAPMDLLNEPVHAWHIPGHGVLGHLLPVVVRSQERWQEEEFAPSREALRDIWSRTAASAAPIQWLMCDGTADPDARGGDGARRAARGGSDADRSGTCGVALGMTNPPTFKNPRSCAWLRAAVQEGLPVLVWHADGCRTRHDPGSMEPVKCSGLMFRDRFESTLNGTRLIDLPRRLFELRAEARERIADEIVLFWDDADRPYREPLLEEPAYPEVV
ncbi:VMAP-C domain-containing protein [Streptomyces sp. H39-S7]|uniref:VMAP-C domain-containing protein n=1 Tax=Streptomyces sp. H39-S7 TaxID=3004357 RepID=UPI0022B00C56|nr:trypsin-like peptidase domain-containing protein [Streptomyces sp. H39-S7]MCZ4121079.1 trypsin-like peptidase domain-containing protein [Streptomyces sp. H39-S7]